MLSDGYYGLATSRDSSAGGRVRLIASNSAVFPQLAKYRKALLDNALEDLVRQNYASYAELWLADTEWVSSISRIKAHPN